MSETVICSRKEELWELMDDRSKKEYGRDYVERLFSNFSSSVPRYPVDLSPVVRAVRSGLLSRRPLQRYVVGRGAGTLLTVIPVLPVWLADHIAYKLGTATVREFLPAALQQQEQQQQQQPSA